MKRRVVITGMGVISPIGNDLATFRENLKKGTCGKDSEGFPVIDGRKLPPVFRVKNFNPKRHGTHLLDPLIQYAVDAAEQAVADAHFDLTSVDPYSVGLSVSSSKGGVCTLDRFQERFLRHPSAIMGARMYTSAVPNFADQWIARRMKIRGPARCYVAACATGAAALIAGFRVVSEGAAEYCLAGATDASITPLMLAGYYNMKALAKNVIRPFDKRRDGFLVGDGAGVLFLETLESAKARGIRIYGEILESAQGQDVTHPIHFDLKDHALSYTLKVLMERASLTPKEIDYISLHGTGTKQGDLYETLEIKEAFGKGAYRIPMSSTKGMTGHMLGATGAVEIIATLLAMQEGFIPPTVGLEEKDPQCDLDYTPRKMREHSVRTAVKISLGFGGQVKAIAFRKI
ncbi:MAG TPA: beta-ketoacyl-[acyl-carrier-protein] synthase family protein [Candidatus Omnitrophota bacterium]|nr:beta-ketoacyl-[acyl-carrier-protein] synthase family protein [Candidatus Omnitrophota bacterium]HPS36572.1 beta-ketoacyl-[acyl-carrier-protein] synthase family protein [Candidatus Omnitrophota bacterium]